MLFAEATFYPENLLARTAPLYDVIDTGPDREEDGDAHKSITERVKVFWERQDIETHCEILRERLRLAALARWNHSIANHKKSEDSDSDFTEENDSDNPPGKTIKDCQ
jgi:hypothetical protein